MDVHKALNRLEAEAAVEIVAGARVHGLGALEKRRVEAFMRGLNRTRGLAFGHPGLGTTATRSGQRLIIQNDIGTTDAHVLVIHAEDLTVTITYTDIHRQADEVFHAAFRRTGCGVERACREKRAKPWQERAIPAGDGPVQRARTRLRSRPSWNILAPGWSS